MDLHRRNDQLRELGRIVEDQDVLAQQILEALTGHFCALHPGLADVAQNDVVHMVHHRQAFQQDSVGSQDLLLVRAVQTFQLRFGQVRWAELVTDREDVAETVVLLEAVGAGVVGSEVPQSVVALPLVAATATEAGELQELFEHLDVRFELRDLERNTGGMGAVRIVEGQVADAGEGKVRARNDLATVDFLGEDTQAGLDDVVSDGAHRARRVDTDHDRRRDRIGRRVARFTGVDLARVQAVVQPSRGIDPGVAGGPGSSRGGSGVRNPVVGVPCGF